jgi:hypothetical protein
MRVRCMSKLASTLPPEYLNLQHGYGADHVFHLTEGREYVVFAVTSFLGGPWIYIADDEFSYYPVWHPTPLFAIVDGRLSETWRAGVQGFGRQEWIFAYQEWAEDPLYYERLVNQEESVVRSFLRHKEILEGEFSE